MIGEALLIAHPVVQRRGHSIVQESHHPSRKVVTSEAELEEWLDATGREKAWGCDSMPNSYLDIEHMEGEVERVGGVKWTIKDGIVYDAKQLLADVAAMVLMSMNAILLLTEPGALETVSRPSAISG